ncbi:zinc transporter [Trifolium pratense]|uniref:Zinc transporter n=1 Tax=Trifolium pratense TaxID=57577 RepID=A0A2K3LBA0_TRIPR|nr:zinc transporter [Trifolium pratense]PNX79004.1 zinc transporter [Trifolium pratense]
MIGVSLPLVSRSIPSLSPERDLFVIVKCFAAGIILGTGFMHVLPDSYDMLRSDCLEEKPWHEFPFSGLVAMFSAVITMMVDSLATSYYSGKSKSGVIIPHGGDQEMGDVNVGHSHGGHHHMHGEIKIEESAASQLLRYRVIAMVLELGIVVHSVVIGLSMGASNNTCSLKGLAAALCFHQMFEGMGLGGCILQVI